MSPVFHASARYWVSGLALAVAGVALNRLLAPHFHLVKASVSLALIGDFIALAGLAVIVTGICRRLKLADAALNSGPEPCPPSR